MDSKVSGEGVCEMVLVNVRKALVQSLILIFSFAVMSQLKAQVQFENTTQALGGPFHTGESWGASWGLMNDDVYPDLYVTNHGMINSLLLNGGDGSFSDVIQSADVDGAMTDDPEQDIHGGAWADFDNDGDQDLFVTRSSKGARVYLFENNGSGRFRERGGRYGIGGVGGGRLPLLFDANNDGRLDVSIAGNNGGRFFYWNNNGNGRFSERSDDLGVRNTCKRAHSAAISDFFDTGSLHYLCTSAHGAPDEAFDMSTTPFRRSDAKFDGVNTTPDSVIADFNNDLKMDLFALRGLVRPSGAQRISSRRIEAWLSVGGTVDYESSITFKANGPITIDVAARSVGRTSEILIGRTGYKPRSLPFTLDPSDSRNWGTVANHRQFKVFVEYNEVAEEWTIYMSAGGNGGGEGAFISVDGNGLTDPIITGLTRADGALRPRFLFNNGTRLVNASSRGIGSVMCGSIAAADFDNDMDIDLYLACRSSTENLENRLYLNDGSGSFSLVSGSTGAEGLLGAGVFGGAGTAETVVTADYDVDGFIDLFVTNGNRLRPRLDQDGVIVGGPDQFYRNLGNGNNWLEIDLQGVNSNRDGFGAKVIVTAGGVSQLREQNGQYHRWSHDHMRLHFGLAANQTADVRIEWPNGTSDIHTGVAANGLYRATQGGVMTNITPTGSAPASVTVDSAVVVPGEDAIVTVNLSSPSSDTVTVDYQTIDGSATSGADYIASSGRLTFRPNQTSKSIVIATVADVVPESDETFTISLSNASNATISRSEGTVTIRSGESVACGSPGVDGRSDKGIYVWQDCNGSGSWSVRGTAGGGAKVVYEAVFSSSEAFGPINPFSFEGSDRFSLSNNDLQLDLRMTMVNAGIDGIDMSLPSSSELCLTLADPNQVIYLGRDRTPSVSPLNLRTATANCGSPLPVLSVTNATVSEGDANAEVTLTLSSAPSSAVSATYNSVDGTAVDGSDYTATSGTVSFAPGETSQTILIPIISDSNPEAAESFSLQLTSPAGAVLNNATAVITITSDTVVNVCGAPTFSSARDAGLFLWKECGNGDGWKLRATAGGGEAVIYRGSLNADTVISFTPFSLEGIDAAELTSGSTELSFTMKMANKGVDGLNIDLSSGANSACFGATLPASVLQHVVVGEDNASLVPPFDLITLDPC